MYLMTLNCTLKNVQDDKYYGMCILPQVQKIFLKYYLIIYYYSLFVTLKKKRGMVVDSQIQMRERAPRERLNKRGESRKKKL